MKNTKIIDEENIKYFRQILLNWYEQNGRYFSWRKKSATNYELIIAEVFLQRTKAETVTKFLPKFLAQYPSWNKLGEATEEEIQSFIRPLGLYKQRGSRLYKLAQELKKRKGRFPKERNKVEDISMMGQYITNALELYVLNKSSPLLDVNMARVLERFFGERKKADIRYDPYLQTLAYRVVDHERAKELNWAIMDFAAMVCKKNIADCERCPMKDNCKFYYNNVL